jgi:tetratricopeptide (TPR) repeat protein
VEWLALHSTKGELWDKALEYVHQAGIKAAEHSAHRQAVAYFEQALEVLARQPRSREMAERAIDLRLDFRNSLHALGDLEGILEHLREAETLATALDDQRRLGQVFAFMTQYFRMTGEPDRAIESGEKALDIARWQPNSTLWIVATMFLGAAHAAVGNYRKAAEILSRTVASIPEQMIHHNWSVNGLLPVFTRAYLGYFLAELGEFGEGLRHAQEALRAARAADKPYSLIFACGGAGTLHLLKGELDHAVEVLEQGLALCRTSNLPVALPVLAASLGPAYALRGRTSDAIHLLEQAVDQARTMKRAGGHALLLLQLGDAYRLGGRITDASVIAQHALDLARTHKERGHEAYALRLLADIAAPGPAGARGDAESLYCQALALAEELAMRPLAAHCQRGLGRLHARMGAPPRGGEPGRRAGWLHQPRDVPLARGDRGRASRGALSADATVSTRSGDLEAARTSEAAQLELHRLDGVPTHRSGQGDAISETRAAPGRALPPAALGLGRGRFPSPLNRPHPLLELGEQRSRLRALRGGREDDVRPPLLLALHDVDQHGGSFAIRVS